MKLLDLFELTKQESSCIEYLIALNLLRSSRNCECYLDPMNLVKINELSDKATWRCSKRSCQKKNR